MKPELAALRLGYLSQELRARQHSVVTEDDLLKIKEVQPCLVELNRTLNMLGSRLSGYHRTAFVELKQRLAASHEDQFEERISLLDQAGALPGEPQRCALQDDHWADLQSLLQGVSEPDNAFGSWFVIGDHLGDVVFQLLENKLTVPLPPKQWDYLYEGVDRLPEPLRMRVETTFPVGYNSGAHLGLQLVTTFNSLCALLAEEDHKEPYWDASVGKLWYSRRRTASMMAICNRE